MKTEEELRAEDNLFSKVNLFLYKTAEGNMGFDAKLADGKKDSAQDRTKDQKSA